MNKRDFMAGAALFLLAPVASAQTDVLREAFDEMTEFQRRVIQIELQLMDFYSGQADSQFGPMTRTALVTAAEEISRRTNGNTTFNLENSEDARRYLSMMAQEQFMFIYDDGYEG